MRTNEARRKAKVHSDGSQQGEETKESTKSVISTIWSRNSQNEKSYMKKRRGGSTLKHYHDTGVRTAVREPSSWKGWHDSYGWSVNPRQSPMRPGVMGWKGERSTQQPALSHSSGCGRNYKRSGHGTGVWRSSGLCPQCLPKPGPWRQ